jgi:hypothetical protein
VAEKRTFGTLPVRTVEGKVLAAWGLGFPRTLLHSRRFGKGERRPASGSPIPHRPQSAYCVAHSKLTSRAPSPTTARKRSSGSFVIRDQHAIAVPPLPITPHTYPPPPRVVVCVPAHNLVKCHISTSEDVPLCTRSDANFREPRNGEVPKIHLLRSRVRRRCGLRPSTPLPRRRVPHGPS